jgi:hypothetical protein
MREAIMVERVWEGGARRGMGGWKKRGGGRVDKEEERKSNCVFQF